MQRVLFLLIFICSFGSAACQKATDRSHVSPWDLIWTEDFTVPLLHLRHGGLKRCLDSLDFDRLPPEWPFMSLNYKPDKPLVTVDMWRTVSSLGTPYGYFFYRGYLVIVYNEPPADHFVKLSFMKKRHFYYETYPVRSPDFVFGGGYKYWGIHYGNHHFRIEEYISE